MYMKKYLSVLLISFLFVLKSYAAIWDTYIDKFFDEFYKPMELYTYAKNNWTCSGVINIDSFNKFKVYFSWYLDTNEGILSKDLLSESQKKMYDRFLELHTKITKIKKLDDSLGIYKYSESQIKNISDKLDATKSCGFYSWNDLLVCNIILQRKEVENTLTANDYTEYNTLLANKDSFSPKNKMRDIVLSKITERITRACSGVVPNTPPPIKQSSEIKSLTDGEIDDFIKVVRDKYKLMSKAQKEKFLKFLKELK